MMNHAGKMVKTHARQTNLDLKQLTNCIEECFNCAQACTACADACLSEQNIQSLVRCIRLNLDCADVCDATGRMVSRQTDADWVLLSTQIRACETACQICGEECQRHAEHHEHCKICAEACQSCGEACNELLAAMPHVATTA